MSPFNYQLLDTIGCSNSTMTPNRHQSGFYKWSNRLALCLKTCPDFNLIKNMWIVLKSQVCARKHTNLIKLYHLPRRVVKYPTRNLPEVWWLPKVWPDFDPVLFSETTEYFRIAKFFFILNMYIIRSFFSRKQFKEIIESPKVALYLSQWSKHVNIWISFDKHFYSIWMTVSPDCKHSESQLGCALCMVTDLWD